MREDDVDEVNEAIQGDFEEERREEGDHARARIDPGRFRNEMEADCYAEYVAMGWREPEPRDIEKVVLNRNQKRTESNLIRVPFGEAWRSVDWEELSNIYIDQAMKTILDEAWKAILKEFLKGDSKRIWHGELWRINAGAEEAYSTYSTMKNYVEKYLPSLEFEKSKVRVLVRGDLQEN